MKRVYVAHSREFDFKNELYKPLRESRLNSQYEIILPHEHSDNLFSSKEFFRDGCDIIVVEASYPKIGVGIEVGWADAFDVPIVAMHKKGFKLSGSLKPMSKATFEYENIDEMISKLEKALQRVQR